MSTKNWRNMVEPAPKSDVWTDTYRTGPSEDAQARLDAEWNAAVDAAANAVWSGRHGQSRSETTSAIRALKRTA